MDTCKPGAECLPAPETWSLLQAGLDRIDQGLAVFDHHLRLIGWNDRLRLLLDLPRGFLRQGLTFEQLARFKAEQDEYGAGDRENLITERLRQVQQFQPYTIERRRPNGTILAIRGEPLPGGGFVTVYTDVTARRRFEQLFREQNEDLERRVEDRTAELQAAHDSLLGAVAKQKEIAAALRRSESRLLLVTDSLPAGIAYWDRGLKCLFANRRFAVSFGFEKSNIVGRDAIDVVGEHTLAEMMPYIDRVRGGEEVTFEYHTTVGGERAATIRTWLIPEVQEHKDVVGFFILSLDITRQKQAELAILQAAKMEAVGQLSSGVAHDFNNLLTVVLGNLLPLVDRGDVSAEIRDHLVPAIEAARKGAGLIQRLLSFARRQSLEPRAVDIEELVANLVRLFRRSLPSDIEIVTATRGNSFPALVDPHQLESALLNLALNARDAMPKGGQLRFETTFVSLGGEEAQRYRLDTGDYVRITVADSGLGMSAEVRSRVFEPFFTTKRAGDGSGLGLSMVYGFVRQSHGAVTITSAPGRGTSVVILLPRAHGEERRPELPPSTNRFQAGPEDLALLVEDDANVRAVIRRQLVSLGYRLIEAGSADEALALLENVKNVTLLLSDVVMPGACTGIDLGQAARALKPELAVILMTGHAGTDRATNLNRTPFPILRKPFDERQLSDAIRAAASSASE